MRPLPVPDSKSPSSVNPVVRRRPRRSGRRRPARVHLGHGRRRLHCGRTVTRSVPKTSCVHTPTNTTYTGPSPRRRTRTGGSTSTRDTFVCARALGFEGDGFPFNVRPGPRFGQTKTSVRLSTAKYRDPASGHRTIQRTVYSEIEHISIERTRAPLRTNRNRTGWGAAGKKEVEREGKSVSTNPSGKPFRLRYREDTKHKGPRVGVETYLVGAQPTLRESGKNQLPRLLLGPANEGLRHRTRTSASHRPDGGSVGSKCRDRNPSQGRDTSPVRWGPKETSGGESSRTPNTRGSKNCSDPVT